MKIKITLRYEISVQVEVDPEDVAIAEKELKDLPIDVDTEFAQKYTALQMVHGEIITGVDRIKVKGSDSDCDYADDWRAEIINEEKS